MSVYSFRFNVVENVVAVSRDIQKGFDRMNQSAKSFSDRLGGITGMSKLKSAFSGVQGLVAGAFAVDRIAAFGGAVVDTLAEFEKYEAVLTNTFGDNSVAKTVLNDITQFAAKTPFQVDELTNSFVKLANRGFVPTMNQMANLGDLAASQGKSFDQLAEAILDAETGEFERLKEFGVRASREGSRVMLSFKGIQKEVENSPEAIRAALLALSQEAPGVTGAMEAISKKTGGMLSNMQDQMKAMQLSIGEAFAPIIAAIIPKLTAGFQAIAGWFSRNQEIVQRWIPIIAKIGITVAGIITLGLGLSAVLSAIGAITTALGALFSPLGLVVAAAGLIIYNWETLKSWLAAFSEWVWKNHPFRFLIDLVDRVFPGFKQALNSLFEGVKGAFKGTLDWLWNTFIKPVAGWFSKLFKGFGLNLSGPETIKPAAEMKAPIQPIVSPIGVSPSGQKTTSRQATGGPVMGGIGNNGGNGKNVSIVINKLVESINIYSNQIGDLRSQVRQEVVRALMDAVNDVNYAN